MYVCMYVTCLYVICLYVIARYSFPWNIVPLPDRYITICSKKSIFKPFLLQKLLRRVEMGSDPERVYQKLFRVFRVGKQNVDHHHYENVDY